jgi:hypothetical protein
MKEFYPHLFEKFTEKSDPVSDMGIGTPPQDVIDQFLIDFASQFHIEPYVDFIGNTYDVKPDQVYEIQPQYKEESYPINKLIGDANGKYGLIFAMSDDAASVILDKPSKWGFIYYVNGKAIPLKSLHMHGVIKELLKIRKFNSRTMDSQLRKQELAVEQIKKMKDIYNES